MRNLLSAIIFLLVFVSGAYFGFAQDKLRQVERPSKYVYPNNPVDVISVGLDDSPFENGQILAGANWLRHLTIKIKNVSGKDINWIETNLILREDRSGLSRIVIPVYFGETKLDKIPVELASGQIVTLRPRQDDVDYWVKYSKGQGIEDIDRIILDIRKIRFTDGTGWYVGIPTTKDSKTNNYLPFDLDESVRSKPPLYPNTNFFIEDPSSVFFARGNKQRRKLLPGQP